MITFEHVSKAFDTLTVLDDLNLRVAPRETLGVVGPSGVGKTTILKLIAGIVLPDQGRVTVADDAMGYVFQEHRLLPWRTALENVAAPLLAQGRSRGEARSAAREWLERVGLADFENYHPAELSGGMARRVSIARAFACAPRVLLLDEPFSEMDAALKGSLIAILQRTIEERGMTVVYVTHVLTEALRLADRIVELTPGGPPRELDLSDREGLVSRWLSATLGPYRDSRPSHAQDVSAKIQPPL